MFPGSLAKQFLTKHFVNNYYLIKCHLHYNEMATKYSKSNIHIFSKKFLIYTNNLVNLYLSDHDTVSVPLEGLEVNPLRM